MNAHTISKLENIPRSANVQTELFSSVLMIKKGQDDPLVTIFGDGNLGSRSPEIAPVAKQISITSHSTTVFFLKSKVNFKLQIWVFSSFLGFIKGQKF